MQFIKDIYYLFYPNFCATCQKQLLYNEKIICTLCRHDLPIICYNSFEKNKITAIFYGKVIIENAISFLAYTPQGKAQQLIHLLKYKGREDIGTFLGQWFGHLLKTEQLFTSVDMIIPVPLHRQKLKQRGYNQLSAFGNSLSKELHIPFLEHYLVKIATSSTQTLKDRFDRFHTIQTKFQLIDHTPLRHKHILLIDDVITTGATLIACTEVLKQVEGIQISIATMAYTN